ncbi:MAG: hypothetical protein GY719_32390 [bacterium]|nr:hypothetical protein [bacterium]
MSFLNNILRRLFDAALSPFSGLHPLVGIAVVSLVLGVAMLLVFKWTSKQEKMTAVKRQIHAGLFEIRLFNDNLRAILRAIGTILHHNLRYLGLTVVPLLWMIVPFVLIVAQLQFHYGYQGLEPGAQALVEVELDQSAGGLGGVRPAITLEAPPGLLIEAGPIWVPSARELTWRISAVEQGDYELVLKTSDGEITKSVRVSGQVVRRSPKRLAAGFFNQLLYPAEDPLPASTPIRAIGLSYPAGNAGFEGWESELTWMIFFLVLSIIFAFALRKPLKVTL